MKTIYYHTTTGQIRSIVDYTCRRPRLSESERANGIGLIHLTAEQAERCNNNWHLVSVIDGKLFAVNGGPVEGASLESRPFQLPFRITTERLTANRVPQRGQTTVSVIRCIGIGDMIMLSQIALPSIRSALKGAHITLHTSKAGKRILDGNRNVDAVVAHEWEHGVSPIVEPLKEMLGADFVFNLVNRVDFLPIVLKKGRANNFLRVVNQELSDRGAKKIRAKKAGHTIKSSYESAKWLQQTFSLNGLSPPLIGCQLTSNGKMKRLGVQQWIDLANVMPEITFIWFSDKSNHDLVPRLPFNIINTSARLNLDEYLTLWGACDLTISPDSGGGHISGTMNQPCIVLTGSTRYNDHFLSYPSCVELQAEKKVSCQPCMDWQIRSDCKADAVPWCMENITTEQLVKSIRYCFEQMVG